MKLYIDVIVAVIVGVVVGKYCYRRVYTTVVYCTEVYCYRLYVLYLVAAARKGLVYLPAVVVTVLPYERIYCDSNKQQHNYTVCMYINSIDRK